MVRFKELTEQVLPERAREQGWPLRLDHCFKRVCLDYACGDVWYKHVAKPAERHLEGEALERAVRCAEELAVRDRGLLEARNAISLDYRGKSKCVPERRKSL